MGNIAAIDMNIVILKCAVFDRKNVLFPNNIRKEILRKDSKQVEFYFAHELSFYSVEHGGTFHFFQFNVLNVK